MKSFFYMGRNPRTKSRVSWKIWKIERKGNRIVTRWGPAMVKKRKVVPKGSLQIKERLFASKGAAKEFELKRIQSKLAKGYEKSPRSRA